MVNCESFDLSGIKQGQMIYLRRVGTGDVGDAVKFVRKTTDGIIVYISLTFPQEFVPWISIVELKALT